MSALPKLYEPAPLRRRANLISADVPPGPGDVLTAGRVARLLKCAPRTVTVWIDRGFLRGYTLPCSKDRRVHQADLVEFLLSNGMFRKLAECVVSDAGQLYRARVHDRWGSPVARVAPRDAHEAAGVDWLPGEEPRYELKAATPEAFQVLIHAGFRFEDGR